MSFPRFPTDPTYPSICGYLCIQYRVIRSYNHRPPTDTCVNSCILYSMSNNNGIPVLFADNLMLPLMPLQRLSVDGECRMAAHRLLGCCPSIRPAVCLSVLWFGRGASSFAPLSLSGKSQKLLSIIFHKY